VWRAPEQLDNVGIAGNKADRGPQGHPVIVDPVGPGAPWRSASTSAAWTPAIAGIAEETSRPSVVSCVE
jgi:hypothetical protein